MLSARSTKHYQLASHSTRTVLALSHASLNAEHLHKSGGRVSAMGTATRYGMDGPRILSLRGGASLSVPVETGHEAQPASSTIDTGFFSGLPHDMTLKILFSQQNLFRCLCNSHNKGFFKYKLHWLTLYKDIVCFLCAVGTELYIYNCIGWRFIRTLCFSFVQ